MANQEIPAEFHKLPRLADELARIAQMKWGEQGWPLVPRDDGLLQTGVLWRLKRAYDQAPIVQLLAWIEFNMPQGLEHSQRLQNFLDAARRGIETLHTLPVDSPCIAGHATERMQDVSDAADHVREICRFLGVLEAAGVAKDLRGPYRTSQLHNTKQGREFRGDAQDGPERLAIKLTQRQYQVVLYLWPNKSASFEELIDNVWENPVKDDSISTAIKRLNEKLMAINESFTVSTKNSHVVMEQHDEIPRQTPDK